MRSSFAGRQAWCRACLACLEGPKPLPSCQRPYFMVQSSRGRQAFAPCRCVGPPFGARSWGAGRTRGMGTRMARERLGCWSIAAVVAVSLVVGSLAGGIAGGAVRRAPAEQTGARPCGRSCRRSQPGSCRHPRGVNDGQGGDRGVSHRGGCPQGRACGCYGGEQLPPAQRGFFGSSHAA